MCTGLHVKYTLFLIDFNETWIFLQFFEKYSLSYFMKIRPVGAELLHADCRTDARTDRHDDAKSRFSRFCERA
jgi:hypothetical protein